MWWQLNCRRLPSGTSRKPSMRVHTAHARSARSRSKATPRPMRPRPLLPSAVLSPHISPNTSVAAARSKSGVRISSPHATKCHWPQCQPIWQSVSSAAFARASLRLLQPPTVTADTPLPSECSALILAASSRCHPLREPICRWDPSPTLYWSPRWVWAHSQARAHVNRILVHKWTNNNNGQIMTIENEVSPFSSRGIDYFQNIFGLLAL